MQPATRPHIIKDRRELADLILELHRGRTIPVVNGVLDLRRVLPAKRPHIDRDLRGHDGLILELLLDLTIPVNGVLDQRQMLPA